MDSILHHLQKQQKLMLAMLRRFVEAESPSTDKAAVDRFGAIVADIAKDFGAVVKGIASRQTGNHLRLEFPSTQTKAAGQILLLGHLDTVWDLGTISRMPFRISKGRAYGPGIFDMKGGIVSGLFALSALHELGIPRKKVVFLLNADEEIGSTTSRPFTEKEALKSDCAFVLEPANGLKGAVKTARKGVGDFTIRVNGRSAHAGLDPEKGASAIAELCRQLLRVETFADPVHGITINAGIIKGGTRTNVVPDEAVAEVDVRVVRMRDMQPIERRFHSLKPYDRRTALEITGRFNRPPLERSTAGAALYAKARQLAKPLGLNLEESAVGGGSDGNFTAALGVPTLDGLGAVGEGAHAVHENLVIDELPRRAALLAYLICNAK